VDLDDIARLWSDEAQGYRLCIYGTRLCYEAGFVGLALSAVFISVLGVFHMPVSRVSKKTLFNTRTDMTKSKYYTHHLTWLPLVFFTSSIM
jgi:hypothetical protein